MENLFQSNVDESLVDNLVSGTLIPSKIWPVSITGNGIIKRGTLLAREKGETTYRAYAPGDIIKAVLLTDADADNLDESKSPAAFAGEFNRNKIEMVMGITLDPEAILDAAEDKKIFIAPMNPAPEIF